MAIKSRSARPRTPKTKSTKASSTKQKRDAAPPDAINLLKSDHREVEKLFKQFESTKVSARKHSIVQKICDALSAHAEIEEEIFYPEARASLKRAGEDLLNEAEVEHQGVKRLVGELKNASPDADLYDAKVTVLSEYVKHHVKEEETDLFPKVRKSKLNIEAVGAKLAARKEQLTGKPVVPPPSLLARSLQLLKS